MRKSGVTLLNLTIAKEVDSLGAINRDLKEKEAVRYAPTTPQRDNVHTDEDGMCTARTDDHEIIQMESIGHQLSAWSFHVLAQHHVSSPSGDIGTGAAKLHRDGGRMCRRSSSCYTVTLLARTRCEQSEHDLACMSQCSGLLTIQLCEDDDKKLPRSRDSSKVLTVNLTVGCCRTHKSQAEDTVHHQVEG
eukprot:5665559-Amphidinium_carterae.2